MIIENNKVVRKKRNTFDESFCVGVRADREFWEMCSRVAEIEKISRNALIVRELSKYCEKILSKV